MYLRLIKRILALVITACLLIPSAIATELPHSEPSIKIIATTSMISDIAREIVGDKGSVIGLMGAGIDPHLYKPTRDDIITLNSADVIFYNGLLLEGKMSDALIRVAGSGKKVVPVTEMLESSYLLEPEDFQGHYDPHVWMDPLAWKEAVKEVTKTLSLHNPALAEYFNKNSDRYLLELEALHQYAQKALATVPAEGRVLVTAHDAFNYFGRRYGFEVLGIQGISTESEAGVKDIERIVTLLVDRKVKAVFVESTVSDRNVKALIEGAQARGHKVVIGGTLFSDAMGKPNTYEGTYIGMIDHNVTTIASALGGNVDPKGMNRKLTEKL